MEYSENKRFKIGDLVETDDSVFLYNKFGKIEGLHRGIIVREKYISRGWLFEIHSPEYGFRWCEEKKLIKIGTM